MKKRLLKIIKKNSVVISLTALIVFHFIGNYIWLKADSNPTSIDSVWHLIDSVKFQISFKTILNSGANLWEKTAQTFTLLRESHIVLQWPTFVHFITALLNSVRFSLFRSRLYINFLFSLILILSVYFTGKKYQNRQTGLIAAFVISFYPAIYAYSRQFELDYFLTALVALAFCLWAYSENFTRRLYSILFGLALGITTWIKLQGIFFLFPLILYSLIKTLWRQKTEKIPMLINIAFCFLTSSGLFLLFWGNTFWGNKSNNIDSTLFVMKDVISTGYNHIFYLYPFFKGQIPLPIIPPYDLLGIDSLTYYPRYLAGFISLPATLIFIASIIWLLKSRNKPAKFLLGILITYYFIFTLISAKTCRYMLPALIFLALISAQFLDRLKPKLFKNIFLILLLIIGIRIYFFVSWDAPQYLFLFSERLCKISNEILPKYEQIWPLKQPLIPKDNLLQIKNSPIYKKTRLKLQQGEKLEVVFFSNINNHTFKYQHRMLAFYLYFQDYIYNNQLIIREIDTENPKKGTIPKIRHINTK